MWKKSSYTMQGSCGQWCGRTQRTSGWSPLCNFWKRRHGRKNLQVSDSLCTIWILFLRKRKSCSWMDKQPAATRNRFETARWQSPWRFCQLHRCPNELAVASPKSEIRRKAATSQRGWKPATNLDRKFDGFKVNCQPMIHPCLQIVGSNWSNSFFWR